jgi:hypothetical protein
MNIATTSALSALMFLHSLGLRCAHHIGFAVAALSLILERVNGSSAHAVGRLRISSVKN